MIARDNHSSFQLKSVNYGREVLIVQASGFWVGINTILANVMVGMAEVVSSIKKRTTVEEKLLFTPMLSNLKFCLTCFISHGMRRMVLPKWFARFKNSLYCEFKGGHNLNDKGVYTGMPPDQKLSQQRSSLSLQTN